MKLFLLAFLTTLVVTPNVFAQRFNPIEELNRCYQERSDLQNQLYQCRLNNREERRPKSYFCVVTASNGFFSGQGRGKTETEALSKAQQDCGIVCGSDSTHRCSPEY